jgi:hypothetical protein
VRPNPHLLLMKRPLQIFIAAIFLLISHFSYAQSSSLKEQSRKVIAQLKKDYDYPIGAKDTLIDLNGDNFKDILIEFYYASGTGLKNGIRVYLYNNIAWKFEPCEQLNGIGNPTFYFDKKIITCYYVGNGGGWAAKFKWKGLKLQTLEEFDIDVEWKKDGPIFHIESIDHITKKKTSKTRKMMTLPEEYNYYEYIPIIKGDGL